MKMFSDAIKKTTRMWIVALAATWTVLVAVSFWWDMIHIRQTIEDLAIVAEGASHGKDSLYRQWAATHGGISSPVPMKDYESIARPHRRAELQVHLGMWFLGLVSLGAGAVYLRRRQDDQDRVRMALRESEARFRQLFVQNDDALFLFKAENFEVIDVNPMALELLGLTKQDIIGQTILSVILAEDFQAFVESGAISDFAPVFQIERATSFSKSKGEITVSLRGKILTLENECIVYCSMRDMTEKVRLMEEIQASQAKLIHADKMASLGLLVSSVAHEINNPNTYISANATMLAQSWQDAAPILVEYRREHGEFSLGGLPSSEIETLVPRLFNGIIDGSRRITEIVNNMREFVKTEKSNRQRPVEINRIIQAATSILWHHIHKHTDHFHLELPPAVPPFMGRGQQIEQVVINLIMNALQSLPDKTRGVWVTSLLDDSAGQVVITVRDEGKGMTPGELEQLKEPFFTTKSDEGGTGLGLYISDSIIREHGGTLEFQSEPGSGTIATIRLPAAGTGSSSGKTAADS